MDNFAPAAGPDHYIVTSTRTREELLAREVPKCRVSVAGNSYQVWLIEPKPPLWNLSGKGSSVATTPMCRLFPLSGEIVA